MRLLRTVALLVAGVCLAWPGTLAAQSGTSGTIAGIVRDTTGAVLPGVTVEAASPALIEKVRAAVTDGQGQYKVLDLRPGTYSVTFSLAGFSTVRREGLILATGVTLPANADLAVGSMTETVVVTGASPVVDVQNVRTQTVLTQAVLDAIPSAKTINALSSLTLGATGNATGDVGGNRGESFTTFGVHGSSGNDTRMLRDGMLYTSMEVDGGAAGRIVSLNVAAVQETVIQVGGMSAESETGGPQINAVPKDGGNQLSLYFNTSLTHPNLQASNLTDQLRAQGLTKAPTIKRVYDTAFGQGGPIRKDKLWFYTAQRWWGAQQFIPNIYFNKTQGTPVYTPDLERPGFTDNPYKSYDGRVTWQVTGKQKLAFSATVGSNCYCFTFISPFTAPEANPNLHYYPQTLNQLTWSYAASNKLLFEAGGSYMFLRFYGDYVDGVKPTDIPYRELSTALSYNARLTNVTLANEYTARNPNYNKQGYQRLNVSYVTGSHALKVGMSMLNGTRHFAVDHTNAVRYDVFRGVPVGLTQSASPNENWINVRPNIGLFAQDQWTVKKLTLNLGVRFDSIRVQSPGHTVPAGPWVSERTFPAVTDIPNWKDVTPRMGAAFDLFGNGRTAIKASLGRYVEVETTDTGISNVPSNQIVGLAGRTWADANGNFVPDCNLRSVTANGECGALDNARFGTLAPTVRWDDDVLRGWGKRGYNWQHSVGVQHQLRPGFGVDVSYYRTWFGNFRTTDNTLVAPSDFDTFCITVPTDPKLGAVSGTQQCGISNLRPSKLGQVNNVVSLSSKFGPRTQIFNGVDVGMNMRFGKGGVLAGGVSFGRQEAKTCAQDIDAPPRPGFCGDVLPPWSAGSQVKFNGVYPLPWWGIQVSGVFQNLPGVAVSANYVVPNATIAPSLGRNLSACPTATGPCTATLSIPIIPQNTQFLSRLTQMDARVTKTFRFGKARVLGMIDIYNLANSGTVLGANTQYPTNYRNATAILPGRLVKFGAQFDF